MGAGNSRAFERVMNGHWLFLWNNVDLVGVPMTYAFGVTIGLVANDALVRVLVAILVLMVFPGYLFLAALHVKLAPLIDRLSSVVGTSIVLNGLLALGLTYSLGLNLTTYVAGMFALLLVFSIVAAVRRSGRMGRSEAMSRNFGNFTRGVHSSFSFTWGQTLVVFACLFAVFGVGRFTYVLANGGPEYAEFYAIGRAGKAGDYSIRVDADRAFEVTLGVIHHGRDEGYKIGAQVDGGQWIPLAQFELSDGEVWEETVAIPLPKVEGPHRVQVALRSTRPQSDEKYLILWPWLH